MKRSCVETLTVVVALGLGCTSADMEARGTSGALCDETLSPVTGTDEITPLGFRAADVIAFAARDFMSSLRWGSSTNVTFGPETGRQSLAIQVAYDGGPLTYVRSRPKEGGGSACTDHLTIPVTVRIQSGSGALDETFDADLVALTPFYGTLTRRLALDGLHGTFTATPAAPPNGSTNQIVVNAALSPLGATGRIMGDIEIAGSGSVGVTEVSYAIWPASDICKTPQGDSTGLPIDLDGQVASFTGREGLSLFSAAGVALPLVWKNGSMTRLALATTSLGEGCVRFDQGVAPQLVASFPINLTATTEDGRLNGNYAAELMLGPAANGALQMTEGHVDMRLPVTQAAGAGFSGLGDVSSYEELSLAFLSRVGDAQVSGEIVLNGLKAAPCTMQPAAQNPAGGTSSCEGTNRTVLERGSWVHTNP